MDREIGPLACAVNGKETQADGADVEQVRIRVAKQFAAALVEAYGDIG